MFVRVHVAAQVPVQVHVHLLNLSNIGNKVIKLLESLIGWGVTVTDQGSECQLTSMRGRLHIAE